MDELAGALFSLSTHSLTLGKLLAPALVPSSMEQFAPPFVLQLSTVSLTLSGIISSSTSALISYKNNISFTAAVFLPAGTHFIANNNTTAMLVAPLRYTKAQYCL